MKAPSDEIYGKSMQRT